MLMLSSWGMSRMTSYHPLPVKNVPSKHYISERKSLNSFCILFVYISLCGETGSKLFNINMVQVYAPTQDYDDETIEEFYEKIQSAICYTKSCDIICFMRDLNVKVDNVKDSKIVGNDDLGKQNERG